MSWFEPLNTEVCYRCTEPDEFGKRCCAACKCRTCDLPKSTNSDFCTLCSSDHNDPGSTRHQVMSQCKPTIYQTEPEPATPIMSSKKAGKMPATADSDEDYKRILGLLGESWSGNSSGLVVSSADSDIWICPFCYEELIADGPGSTRCPRGCFK
ncbi:hypothetical protein IWQ61_003240 [Dispira simplex]|nr:hypothetical protein IWQ61_003240 [Dispira simplex]